MRFSIIAAAVLLAAGVNAQIETISKDGRAWKVPKGLDLYPCIKHCGEHWHCQPHPFASMIHACGGGENWDRCSGFCVPN